MIQRATDTENKNKTHIDPKQSTPLHRNASKKIIHQFRAPVLIQKARNRW